MKTSTRNDVKQLAISIESLAREIQNKIDSGSDVLATANELVRNNLTLVFALGEVSAVEYMESSKKKTPLVKKGLTRNYSNYYRVRDSLTGRFTAK